MSMPHKCRCAICQREMAGLDELSIQLGTIRSVNEILEAKDQRIAELEAELQTAWNACDAAEVKGRHVEAVLNQLKSAIAASEDTRKKASREKA